MANQGIYTNSTWVHGVQFNTPENVPLAMSGTYECDVLRKGDTGTPVFTFNTADGTLDHTDQAIGSLVLTATPAQHQPDVTAGKYMVYMRRVDGANPFWAATGEMVVGKPGDSETYIRFDAATDGSTAETYAVALAGPAGTTQWSGILGKPYVETVADLFADTTFSYTSGTGKTVVVADNLIATKLEGFVFKVAASASTDNHITTAGGVKLYVNKTSEGNVSALQFGVLMDGATDNVLALQKSFTYSSTTGVPLTMPYGVCNVSDSIYAWGDFRLIGSGIRSTRIQLTALPTVPVGEEASRYWFVLGASSRGGASQVWTGGMSDIEFDVPSSLSSSINTAVYLGSVDGACLERVRVNTNGNVLNNGFGRKNNSLIVTSPVAKNILFNDCEVGETQSGDGEPLGLASVSGFGINNLRVYGEAGDDVGIHTCSNGVINDLYMESTGGRLYISDSKNITANNPFIDYVDPATLVSMGIVIQSESVAAPNFCDGITINSPTVKYRAGVLSSNYGMRITGRNVRITNPRMIREDTAICARIVVEDQTLAGWVDPSGIDAADTPSCHNVLIDGAQVDDEIAIAGTGDGVAVVNSVAARFTVTGTSLERWDNNIAIGTLTDSVFSSEEGPRKAAKKIFTVVVANSGAAFIDGKEFPNVGSVLHRVQRNVAITHHVLSSDVAIATGFYQYQMRRNGANMAPPKAWSQASGQKAELQFIASSTTKDYFASRGDTLGCQAKSNNGTPTPATHIIIEAYGLEL